MNSISLRFLETAKIFQNDLSITLHFAVSEQKVYISDNVYFIVFPADIVFLHSDPVEHKEVEHLKNLIIKDLLNIYEKKSGNHYKIREQLESNKFIAAYTKEFSYASKLYYCYAKHMLTQQTTFTQYMDFM